MYRVTSALFLILALLSATGGQIAALQFAAWTGMMINYSKESGLIRGFERTFSGEEPCRLCHMVERAQKETEQQKPTAPTSTRIEPEVFVAPGSAPFLPTTSSPQSILAHNQQGVRRIYPVPVPPPRHLG